MVMQMINQILFSEQSDLKLAEKICRVDRLIKWQMKLIVNNYKAMHTRKKTTSKYKHTQ